MTTDTHKLDKMDVAALRKADSISFHHITMSPSTPHISASKRIKNDPFQDEARREIPVTSNLADGDVAFEMIHSSQYHQAWQTIAKLLRPDDVLRLEWNADLVERDVRCHRTRARSQIERQRRLRHATPQCKFAFFAQYTCPASGARS